ncbi:MAG: hypothetical protein V6Z89_18390 [Desulfobacter sp.]
MKHVILFTGILMGIAGFCTTAFSQDTHSGRAVNHGSQAASHASGSAAHAISASGQAVSGAASVPFMVSGAAGASSAQIGEDLHNAASEPIGTPLEITDETITIGPPPDQALNANTGQN